MNKIIFYILLGTLTVNSQNLERHYLELKDGIDLGNIQITANPDGTLVISTSLPDFSNFLNSKSIYSFEKTFPTSTRVKLQQVYTITLDENTTTSDFNNRTEVEKIFMDESSVIFEDMLTPEIYPNDFDDIIYGGRNTALDLVKAPLAWTISSGDPNQMVGVADTRFDNAHEDLTGQMVDDILIYNSTTLHGTGVAGVIAAVTDNGLGVSSIAHNTKLIGASCGGFAMELITGLLKLSQYPGVRVINCSWGICESSFAKEYLDEVIQEVDLNEVLVVAGAGNGPGGNSCDGGHGYAYPASYDSTISVTSVGHRYHIGRVGSDNYWVRSWKDVHEFRPHTADPISHTHNDKVDVSAPGQLVTTITDDYTNHPSGYKIGSGTSNASPHVTAVAALIFAVNPSLTPAEVKSIIKLTADDIYYIPENSAYVGLLGSGRVNAYRAVLTAQCMSTPSSGLDLAMQNSPYDSFTEPDIDTSNLWLSEDIWVRNQNDGVVVREHQNPEYIPSDPTNYVYVNITNNSCETSSGNDDLKLYWSKANTSLSWPDHWNGTFYMNDPVTGLDILMGDEIGTVAIPILEPGESRVLEFQWSVPNPQDYVNINSNPWHFCLLARIESIDDPMTFTEVTSVTQNVMNNNNIAWKNMTVIEIAPSLDLGGIGGVIAVGNPFATSNTFNLEFSVDDQESGKAIYDEAEVSIEMDETLYDAWVRGGKIAFNLDSTNTAQKKIIVDDDAVLSNIQFDPNEHGTLYLSFNFLTDELSNKENYKYHVIQKYASSGEILGGETYDIYKEVGPSFDADAGDDAEIYKNDSVTITASQINEAAIYNWYAPDGTLIYSGTELTVTPNITQTYKLEIISDLSGHKDYDEVEVVVNPFYIESLTPNPASNDVLIEYLADDATSAYLMLINTNTGSSDNYILDTSISQATIDVSSYPTGIYSLSLVCDGSIQDSDLLIIE